MSPTELEAQLERLHPECWGWALNCCGGNETQASDVLQTSYVKVVSGRAQFEGRSAFRTWLFGVIRRTALEDHRRDRAAAERTVPLSAEDLQIAGDDDPQTELEREETGAALRRKLELLSERQREVLHLVFYQDLSIAEAAEVMGVTLGSARTHYERGKARLRSLLSEERETHERSATGR